MEKFLGAARTVDELLEMIEPYHGFSIVLTDAIMERLPQIFIVMKKERLLEYFNKTLLDISHILWYNYHRKRKEKYQWLTSMEK